MTRPAGWLSPNLTARHDTTQIVKHQPEEELALVPAMEHDEHEGLDEASLKEHEEVGGWVSQEAGERG